MKSTLTLYEIDPRGRYTIDAVAHLAGLPRRRVALYCRYGIITPSPPHTSGGWFFSGDAILALHRAEYLRLAYGLNPEALGLLFGLAHEVAHLREELRARAR